MRKSGAARVHTSLTHPVFVRGHDLNAAGPLVTNGPAGVKRCGGKNYRFLHFCVNGTVCVSPVVK